MNWIQYGLPTSATARSNSRTPTAESPSPTTPLTIARATLSSSSCRITRQRLAPSDTRTATSRARRADLASRRLATLAQAINSTKPTAPIRVRKMIRISPPLAHSLNVWTTASKSVFVSGYCVANWPAMALSSACA